MATQCAGDGGDTDDVVGKARMVLEAKRRQNSKESTGHPQMLWKACGGVCGGGILDCREDPRRAGSPVCVLPEAQSLVPSLQGQKLVLRRGQGPVHRLRAAGLSRKAEEGVEGCLSLSGGAGGGGQGKGHEDERHGETGKLGLRGKPGSLRYSRKEMPRGNTAPGNFRLLKPQGARSLLQSSHLSLYTH